MEDATQKPARIGLAELEGLVGRQLGSSRWHRISQQEIDKFAEATGDFQPIHVDPQAARNGPYGKTIAHGFLTLSLVASLTPEGMAAMDQIAEAILELQKEIPGDIDWALQINGHTDARPISNPQYPSNWELSTARAASSASTAS